MWLYYTLFVPGTHFCLHTTYCIHFAPYCTKKSTIFGVAILEGAQQFFTWSTLFSGNAQAAVPLAENLSDVVGSDEHCFIRLKLQVQFHYNTQERRRWLWKRKWIV